MAVVAATLVTVLALLACTANPAPPPADGGRAPAFGAFLGSDASGVNLIPAFEEWLGRQVTVGHTYLPPNSWEDVRGPAPILSPWAQWRTARPERLLLLNVPMLVPNESSASDREVAALLARGASGEFDENFRVLGERLVYLGAADTVLLPGWEMNGTTYTSRCEPDPEAWKQYWRNIVKTMRSVPGQRFRFDFNPSRGVDAIPWTTCYPGDDVVDIIGMDTYDQPPGDDFLDYVNQPNGLQDHVDFARERDKPISFPEWGLYRHGDQPQYVRDMYEWIRTHSDNIAYHTITDYCPHGVWRCTDNPESSAAFQELFGSAGG